MKEEDLKTVITDSLIQTNLTIASWEKNIGLDKFRKSLQNNSFELNGLFKNFLARFLKTYVSTEDIKRTIKKMYFEVELMNGLTGFYIDRIKVKDYGDYLTNQTLANLVEKAFMKLSGDREWYKDCYHKAMQIGTKRWVNETTYELHNPGSKPTPPIPKSDVTLSSVDSLIKNFNFDKIKQKQL